MREPFGVVRARRWARVLAAALTFGFTGPAVGDAEREQTSTVSVTATLSVLRGRVTRIAATSPSEEQARDGVDLEVGDRVRTGSDSIALVTFLDGTTVTIEPDSEVEIQAVELGADLSRIRLRVELGKVWARVARMLAPTSEVSLESNAATAAVRDGLIGAGQAGGEFTCWTNSGDLTVRDAEGRELLVLRPGQKTTVRSGEAPRAVPFAVNRTTLRVEASGAVAPLLATADTSRVAGFVAPGVEVNQVFGSLTQAKPDGVRLLEVPAGTPGPFTVVFEGLRAGPFEVTVSGLYDGRLVYQEQLVGKIQGGERLQTRIEHQLDPEGASDPKRARVVGGEVASLSPLRGPLPGEWLLSPAEVEASTK